MADAYAMFFFLLSVWITDFNGSPMFSQFFFIVVVRVYMWQIHVWYICIVMYSVHTAHYIVWAWTIASNRIHTKKYTTDYISFTFYFILFHFTRVFFGLTFFSLICALCLVIYIPVAHTIEFCGFPCVFLHSFFELVFRRRRICILFTACRTIYTEHACNFWCKKKLSAWLSLAFN